MAAQQDEWPCKQERGEPNPSCHCSSQGKSYPPQPLSKGKNFSIALKSHSSTDLMTVGLSTTASSLSYQGNGNMAEVLCWCLCGSHSIFPGLLGKKAVSVVLCSHSNTLVMWGDWFTFAGSFPGDFQWEAAMTPAHFCALPRIQILRVKEPSITLSPTSAHLQEREF